MKKGTRKLLPVIVLCIIISTSCRSNKSENSGAKINNYSNPVAAKMLKTAAHMGRLDRLPPAHKNFKIATAGSPFTRSFYIMFEAPAEEIKSFVLNSKGIEKKNSEMYSPEHMRIEYSSYNEIKNYQHDNFVRRNEMPAWWKTEIKVKGRKYNITPEKGRCQGGMVIINEKMNEVYIFVYWS